MLPLLALELSLVGVFLAFLIRIGVIMSTLSELTKTAKLDSTTIVHLILLAVIGWLCFFHIPDLMESHRADMTQLQSAINQLTKEHEIAMSKVVDRLDKLYDKTRKGD